MSNSDRCRAGDISFERVQLSNEFFAEGGTFGDWDNDGSGDVVVGPWIYWGPNFLEKSRLYEGNAVNPVGYSENFLAFADDVDRDQLLDVIVIGFPGKESWWYRNPGKEKARQLWTRNTILDVVDNESPLVSDLDGDGVLDLVCSSKGSYGYATHAGADPTQPWHFQAISPNNGYHRFTHGIGTGDVNNDGRQDLLEKNGWWENPGKPLGEGQTWAFHPFEFSAGGGSQMYAVDLDGDGRNEVLSGLAAHGFGLSYFKATNSQATQFERHEIMTDSAATSPTGIAISQLHAVAIADISGDGIVDIVTGKRWWAHAAGDVGSSQPAALVWLETQRVQGGVKFVAHGIDVSSGVGTQVTVGDVNGDGRQDIVSGNKRGAYLFLQRSPQASQPMLAALASQDPFGQAAATKFFEVRDSVGGVRPAMADGRPLNLSLDSDLTDWEVRGTLASSARDASGQLTTGAAGNKAHFGEIISRPFLIDHGRGSLQVAGSGRNDARVELIDNDSGQVIASWMGDGKESLQRVECNLEQWRGHIVRLRIVDHDKDGFVVYDDFRLYP